MLTGMRAAVGLQQLLLKACRGLKWLQSKCSAQIYSKSIELVSRLCKDLVCPGDFLLRSFQRRCFFWEESAAVQEEAAGWDPAGGSLTAAAQLQRRRITSLENVLHSGRVHCDVNPAEPWQQPGSLRKNPFGAAPSHVRFFIFYDRERKTDPEAVCSSGIALQNLILQVLLTARPLKDRTSTAFSRCCHHQTVC